MTIIPASKSQVFHHCYYYHVLVIVVAQLLLFLEIAFVVDSFVIDVVNCPKQKQARFGTTDLDSDATRRKRLPLLLPSSSLSSSPSLLSSHVL